MDILDIVLSAIADRTCPVTHLHNVNRRLNLVEIFWFTSPRTSDVVDRLYDRAGFAEWYYIKVSDDMKIVINLHGSFMDVYKEA